MHSNLASMVILSSHLQQSGNPHPALPLVRGRIKGAPAPDQQTEYPNQEPKPLLREIMQLSTSRMRKNSMRAMSSRCDALLDSL